VTRVGSRKTKDPHADLLQDAIAACSAGVAEAAPDDPTLFLKTFLVVPHHLRVLDPQAKLVVGAKGSGKSEFFRVLTNAEGRQLLSDAAAQRKYPCPPLARTDWSIGFSLAGSSFPPPDRIETTVRGYQADPQQCRRLWISLLLHVLRMNNHILSSELSHDLGLALDKIGYEPRMAIEALRVGDGEGSAFRALDALDHHLDEEDRHLFVVYDELDRVSPGDWSVVRAVINGLMQLWATYSRRWRRLRCKIFLRSDLLRHAGLSGPDLAKLAWRPAELTWDSVDAYRMLFKRLGVASPRLRTYLENGGLVFVPEAANTSWRTGDPVGSSETFAGVVAHMFGEHMGPDPRKGLTLRWIPNHLQDGHGRLYPRSILRLVEAAAQRELRDRTAEPPSLIHHTALRGALDEVSSFRVKELVQEEFKWMARVQRAFCDRQLLVPAERREVLRYLRIDWANEAARPPEEDPDALLDYLVDIGVASRRTDGKIDVGDLYLKGLCLKRKGGPRRPRSS
jgi:hypothetical protein